MHPEVVCISLDTIVGVWVVVPLVLSSRAMAFCSATFQMMSRLSALALANTSGLCGHHDIAVIVFLCSDMIARSLNSLYL